MIVSSARRSPFTWEIPMRITTLLLAGVIGLASGLAFAQTTRQMGALAGEQR